MFSTAGSPEDAKPAVVDGRVVMLPTLAGLVNGTPATPSKPSGNLWNALAAAVLAEEAFVDAADDVSSPMAEVIDIGHYRTSHEI